MRFRLISISSIIAFIILGILPVLLWYGKESVPVSVAVIDKTVPREDYREHLGLFWALEHNKIVKADGEFYQLNKDFYGYKPEKQEGDNKWLLEGFPDLIYVADTYGVFSADFDKNIEGKRSELIYGGLTLFEWNRIIDVKQNDTTLIMEFNSIASPTESFVREQVEHDMGFSWTGWIGRYFPDLHSSEVPNWLKTNYEEQYQDKWQFRGKGIAFVDESDHVVILDGDDFQGFVSFNWTDAGKVHYPYAENSTYGYWFDIIIPNTSYLIEAKYQIDFTEAGESKLAKSNIPLEFPAVIFNEEEGIYYFAGDYADVGVDYAAKWMMPQSFYQLIPIFSPENNFFWKSYTPMMKVILEEIAGTKE